MTNSKLKLKLQKFISSIPKEKLIKEMAATSEYGIEHIESTFDTFVNESFATLKLIEKELVSKDVKLIEIGAGLCIFSLFLKSEDFNITALEPASNGYDFFEVMRKTILEHYSKLDLHVLPIKAEQINSSYGYFDVVFSNNVIEHIPDFRAALDALHSCLTKNGKQLHTCANYAFPYEPHLSIPVLKAYPKISEILFRKKVKLLKEMWDSLNFITAHEVKKYACIRKINCKFEKGILYNAFVRLDNDDIYKERHSNRLILTTYKLLKYTKMLTLLKHFPVRYQSPMIFTLKNTADKNQILIE